MEIATAQGDLSDAVIGDIPAVAAVKMPQRGAKPGNCIQASITHL